MFVVAAAFIALGYALVYWVLSANKAHGVRMNTAGGPIARADAVGGIPLSVLLTGKILTGQDAIGNGSYLPFPFFK